MLLVSHHVMSSAPLGLVSNNSSPGAGPQPQTSRIMRQYELDFFITQSLCGTVLLETEKRQIHTQNLP